MKFLCPNCKAKYQIADEKLAGRAVKMKCRKCGHLIEIGKDTDEAAGPGAAATGPPLARPVTSAAPPARSQAPSGAARPPPRPPPARPRPAGAAAVSAPKAAASVSPPARPSTPGAPPARPSAPGAAPKPGVPAARPEPVISHYEPDEETRALTAGALAGAFSQAVAAAPTARVSQIEVAGSDEWYVGINGVPVGPIKLSTVRQKAQLGAITVDSLVWRDGFEQWQPLRTFPELVAVVEEGASSARASLGPLAPPVAGLEAASAPATSLPITGPAVVEEIAGLPKRSGSPRAAWLAVAVALAFGLTIGFVVFGGKPAEVVKYVEVQRPGTAGATAATPTAVATGAATPESIGEATVGAQKAGKSQLAAKGGADPTTAPSGKGLSGLAGLSGLSGLGPSSGSPGGPGQSGGGGEQLDSTAVQRTVGRYTPSVKRSCWEPALAARDKDAPSSARVSVTIKVAPSGTVESASTSGDPKGYRGLASCIASRVRGWQFPASSGSTTVGVPFVFVAQ